MNATNYTQRRKLEKEEEGEPSRRPDWTMAGEQKVNRLKQENQKGQFRRRTKKGTTLDERDPR